jgi:hypothetical protein
MTPIDTPTPQSRIRVVAEGVLASYIHELSAAGARTVAAVPVPVTAQSPNCGMEAA